MYYASYAQLKNKHVAAAAWIMETISQQYQWQGSGLVYAPNNSSYGGEIYRLYLICWFLHEMWFHNVSFSVRVHIRCDNLAGIYDCYVQAAYMTSLYGE